MYIRTQETDNKQGHISRTRSSPSRITRIRRNPSLSSDKDAICGCLPHRIETVLINTYSTSQQRIVRAIAVKKIVFVIGLRSISRVFELPSHVDLRRRIEHVRCMKRIKAKASKKRGFGKGPPLFRLDLIFPYGVLGWIRLLTAYYLLEIRQ